MQEKAPHAHPLSDLAYDWITLMQNKAQALMAYDQYIKDAEAAGSPECAAFFRKVHEADKAQLEEALYEFGAEIESNAVEVYVSRLRKKLGAEKIATVRGVGYRFDHK